MVDVFVNPNNWALVNREKLNIKSEDEKKTIKIKDKKI